MSILTDNIDLCKIREAGNILREIFLWIGSVLEEGISTAELDRKVESFILSKGARPAFKGYRGYPATICASINEVVVHGIPADDVILKSGDIVGIDAGLEKNGFFVDSARTYAVGKVSKEAGRLIEVTRICLKNGIEKAIAGNRVSDISNAIQFVAQGAGYQEVRTFVGHGIGKELHEAPEVPNWGEKGKGPVMKEGLLLAIEPMINIGSREVKVLSDGWTAMTADGKLSAHFEDTVRVGKEKAEIIT